MISVVLLKGQKNYNLWYGAPDMSGPQVARPVRSALNLALKKGDYDAIDCAPQMEPGLRVTGHRVTGSAILAG